MPNAQTHLSSVWHLLAQPPIQAAFPWLAEDCARSAMLLGAISPDARVVSGHPRTETHFFDIPMQEPGHRALFRQWPALADAAALGEAHAAFIAGYLTHLIMDQTWVEVIVMPGLFVEGQVWGVEHPNWRLYSLLMTYLEYRAAERLPARAVDLLAQAEPRGWLPFVSDHHLAGWRDHVVGIIRTGGPRLLSRMFAETNDLTAEQMEAIVLSEARMEEEVYHTIPRERLLAFEEQVGERSQQVVIDYLSALAVT
ncbi:MAG TPA: hypothetical protein PK801_00230 [Aggregatilineales bacterium]|nr:hypothetical protein [Chloroflexota bacterium]HOA24705.1 hypothetical protein [Aggregatilineales bacterium]HPV08290.1 hypothetical protein [Aggregatilineales bacterium]HQA66718.1 hypothetical protein [Aggregatilineales bacterium]HQE19883.1 hypothetical protein [Aggregatilineales bacterium]